MSAQSFCRAVVTARPDDVDADALSVYHYILLARLAELFSQASDLFYEELHTIADRLDYTRPHALAATLVGHTVGLAYYNGLDAEYLLEMSREDREGYTKRHQADFERTDNVVALPLIGVEPDDSKKVLVDLVVAVLLGVERYVADTKNDPLDLFLDDYEDDIAALLYGDKGHGNLYAYVGDADPYEVDAVDTESM